MGRKTPGQLRREEAIRRIQQAADVDEGLAIHMHDKQISPEMYAAMRRVAEQDTEEKQ